MVLIFSAIGQLSSLPSKLVSKDFGQRFGTPTCSRIVQEAVHTKSQEMTHLEDPFAISSRQMPRLPSRIPLVKFALMCESSVRHTELLILQRMLRSSLLPCPFNRSSTTSAKASTTQPSPMTLLLDRTTRLASTCPCLRPPSGLSSSTTPRN